MKRTAAGFRLRKRVVIGPTVSLLVLAVLFWKADARLETVVHQWRTADGGMLLFIALFSVLWHVFLGAHKWWWILRALGADVRFYDVWRVRLGSDPIRFAAPLKAGEIVNAAYFARHDALGFSRAAGSVVFDKSLNFFGTVFWLYVGMAALAEIPLLSYVILHTTIAAGVVALVALAPLRAAMTATAKRVHGKLGRLAAGVLSAFEEFSLFQKIGFLVYGILFQLRPLMVCWLLLVAFHPDRMPAFQQFLALGSIVVLMSNIPSVGGIGPREAALMALFADFASQETLLSIGLLMSFFVQLLPALLGIPWMFPLLRELVSPTTTTRNADHDPNDQQES